MHPDPDGDAIIFGLTREAMRSPGRDLPVRVLIHEDAHLEDARRVLTKALNALDSVFELLREDTQRELFARAGVPAEPPF
jgi:hypothetical protein